MKIICIGGGAASFFYAANVINRHPHSEISILEQGKDTLQKVRISGGGRCNLTHACFDPRELVLNYPRGERELLGPFHKFQPGDTIDWFDRHGVPTVAEEDGRMFPEANTSQVILDCLRTATSQVEVLTSTKVTNIKPIKNGTEGFKIETLHGDPMICDRLFVAPGSSKQFWQVLEGIGFTVVPPVPSLFTFQIKDERLDGLPGISFDHVEITIPGTDWFSDGPMLITHKGLSGPAVLKLSARAARFFHTEDYKTKITIDFKPEWSDDEVLRFRESEPKTLLGNHHTFGFSKRFHHSILKYAGIDPQSNFASLSKADYTKLVDTIKRSTFDVLGQNRFKEEFVTAGGVDLKEINFKDFSSKIYPNMYLAGEVLNIDAVTGGFNFQAAWTGAWLAAQR